MKAAQLKQGDLVDIEWLDAAGFVNEPLSKAVPARAKNTGYVDRVERRYLILCSGEYQDADPDTCGDYTVIPRDWFESIKLLKRGRKKK